MDMLANTPVEVNCLETLAKNFISPAKKKRFLHRNISNNAPVHRIAIPLTTNIAFTGDYTKNPFWCQRVDLRQSRLIRGGQPIVDIDAADKCRLYITTMKATNFQIDIPSIPIDKFKHHYVLLSDVTSTQDAIENCQFPEIVAEPLRLDLNFTFPLEHVAELIVLGK